MTRRSLFGLLAVCPGAWVPEPTYPRLTMTIVKCSLSMEEFAHFLGIQGSEYVDIAMINRID